MIRLAGACAPTVPVLFGTPPDAGFSFHCGPPGEAGAYIRSTSVSGLPATLGDELREVVGSIQVSVKSDSARLAPERALAEHELGFHPSTGRARLGRGIEAIGNHQPTAVPPGLVRKHAAQLTDARITEGTSQSTVAHQSGDIEVFHHHRAIFGDEVGW